VLVDACLEVPDWPGVWALCDCAMIPDPRTGQVNPPTAQHAMRQGKVLAGNIAAAIRGGEKKPCVFSTIGMLAAIGRRTGVARILGMNFSGFVAWVLWRAIYLGKLPRLEKKVRVALDWVLDLVFSRDLVQLRLQLRQDTGPTASHRTGTEHQPTAAGTPLADREAAR
jgi:NADH dehydrogenase